MFSLPFFFFLGRLRFSWACFLSWSLSFFLKSYFFLEQEHVYFLISLNLTFFLIESVFSFFFPWTLPQIDMRLWKIASHSESKQYWKITFTKKIWGFLNVYSPSQRNKYQMHFRVTYIKRLLLLVAFIFIM